MDSSDPPALNPCNNNTFTIMKEVTPFNQVVAFKVASNMQRVIQVVQRVAQKSCRGACQLFCCPLDALLCEKGACCPAQNHQLTEDKTTQVTLQSSPSTIMIVNISNSTLIDCVIGKDTYLSAVAESQPLMQEPELNVRCSCSHGQRGAARTCPPPPPPPAPPLPLGPPLPPEEPASISIHSSHLNCVIIGDNNYMHAQQNSSDETQEPQL